MIIRRKTARVFQALLDNVELSSTEICALPGVGTPAGYSILSRMEYHQWVTRRHHPTPVRDPTHIYYSLNDAGKRYAKTRYDLKPTPDAGP